MLSFLRNNKYYFPSLFFLLFFFLGINIYQLTNKENINKILDKAREELKNGIKKDQYFSDEDRDLLSTFIKKITRELGQN